MREQYVRGSPGRGNPGLQSYASCAGRLLKILAVTTFGLRFCKNLVLDPLLTDTFLKRSFLTDFKRYTQPPPPQRDKILAHWTKSLQNPGKVPKPTVLAHYECPGEICRSTTHNTCTYEPHNANFSPNAKPQPYKAASLNMQPISLPHL